MAPIKLICIHYAGGSAQTFYTWRKTLLPEIELHAIELKGRGKRIQEPLNGSFDEVIDDLYAILSPIVKDSKAAFFGHSMGCLLLYELLWKLHPDITRPEHVFFSGWYPPYLNKKLEQRRKLTDKEFLQFASSLFGSFDTIFLKKDYCESFLPILRNDMRIVEEYTHQHDRLLLTCPITVFYGKFDKLVSKEESLQWNNVTSGEVTFLEFEEGHFFIRNYKKEIINHINTVLS